MNFLKTFNWSRFSLTDRIPELWNKLVRALGKFKDNIKKTAIHGVF